MFIRLTFDKKQSFLSHKDFDLPIKEAFRSYFPYNNLSECLGHFFNCTSFIHFLSKAYFSFSANDKLSIEHFAPWIEQRMIMRQLNNTKANLNPLNL